MGDWTGHGVLFWGERWGAELPEGTQENVPSKRKTQFRRRLRKTGNLTRGSGTILPNWFVHIVELNGSGQEQKIIFEGPQMLLVRGRLLQQGWCGPPLKF